MPDVGRHKSGGKNAKPYWIPVSHMIAGPTALRKMENSTSVMCNPLFHLLFVRKRNLTGNTTFKKT